MGVTGEITGDARGYRGPVVCLLAGEWLVTVVDRFVQSLSRLRQGARLYLQGGVVGDSTRHEQCPIQDYSSKKSNKAGGRRAVVQQDAEAESLQREDNERYKDERRGWKGRGDANRVMKHELSAALVADETK